MAERAYTITQTNIYGIVLVEWAGLLNTDTGKPVKVPNFADKTIQVSGTLGAGGSLSFQGSNDPADPPSNFGVLHRADAALGDMVFTSAEGLEPSVALENPLWVRPIVTAGDGTTNLTCRMVGRNT